MVSRGLFAAVAAAMCGLTAASSRLRETPLNLQKMRLEGVDPVDPDGDHGPKRIAGFFELNRTEVRCTLGCVPDTSAVPLSTFSRTVDDQTCE